MYKSFHQFMLIYNNISVNKLMRITCGHSFAAASKTYDFCRASIILRIGIFSTIACIHKNLLYSYKVTMSQNHFHRKKIQ